MPVLWNWSFPFGPFPFSGLYFKLFSNRRRILGDMVVWSFREDVYRFYSLSGSYTRRLFLLLVWCFNLTSYDWPLTAKELIFQEAFNLPWTFPFIIISLFPSLSCFGESFHHTALLLVLSITFTFFKFTIFCINHGIFLIGFILKYFSLLNSADESFRKKRQ